MNPIQSDQSATTPDKTNAVPLPSKIPSDSGSNTQPKTEFRPGTRYSTFAPGQSKSAETTNTNVDVFASPKHETERLLGKPAHHRHLMTTIVAIVLVIVAIAVILVVF